jgi:hypothetical protein
VIAGSTHICRSSSCTPSKVHIHRGDKNRIASKGYKKCQNSTWSLTGSLRALENLSLSYTS